ncbi:MAG: MerR family transcriptional regulator [Chitinophagaceae bacterium]|nr:MerR family transcriptional regulator [Chitinophagaceae bacterium]
MGQLSLFDAFGPQPNPVPKPPRPPKRNEKVIVENSLEKKAENKPEAPAFVIEEPIETPSFVMEAPIVSPQIIVTTSPTPGSGFYYEPPLYEAPVVEAIQPVIEKPETSASLVEEESNTWLSPTAIELPKKNELPVTNEKPMLELAEEVGIQHGATRESSFSNIQASVPEPEVSTHEEPITTTSSASIVKTKPLAKSKEKVVAQLKEDIQEEAPNVIDIASLTKQYYSISEVANMFSVNASHLRYWEKEFPTQLGNVRKNGKGDRFYTPKNIAQLQVIFHLVRNKKMTLEGARKQLKLKKKSLKAEADTYELLQQVRRFLVDLKSQFD